MHYREATEADLHTIARLRAREYGREEDWYQRILAYMNRRDRVLYVAMDDKQLAGFIAGHLTQRYGCEGELQWINVIPPYRGKQVSSQLLRRLADWFALHNARAICVNCTPDNTIAQRFYRRHGAEPLNDFWLAWKDIRVVL